MLIKILNGIGVLIFVTFVVTAMIYLSPVDAERMSFGQRVSTSSVEELREKYDLDQPLRKQYLSYLRDLSPLLVVSDQQKTTARYSAYKGVELFSLPGRTLLLKWPYLRKSYQTDRRVSTILKEVFPLTVILALSAMSIAFVIGVLLGVLAARVRGSFWDQAIVAFSVVGYSIPSYVSSIILALLFGYLWSSWTGLDVQGSLLELNDLGDYEWRWRNLILPSIALGVRPIAVITQLTRASVLDIAQEPYVRTAMAKGISESAIWLKHVLRNALTPVLTASTGWLASMFAGAFFVETVFNYKGLGFTTVNALTQFDIPLILGCVLLTCTIFISTNIFLDLLYRWVDPRMRGK